MTAIVWCSLCGRKCTTHTPSLAVPQHPAPWNQAIACPGTNRAGLVGVR